MGVHQCERDVPAHIVDDDEDDMRREAVRIGALNPETATVASSSDAILGDPWVLWRVLMRPDARRASLMPSAWSVFEGLLRPSVEQCVGK